VAILSHTLRITDDTPLELRKADRAAQSLADTSRSETRALFEQGCVLVNGEPCDQPFRRLSPGDVVEVRRDPAHRPRSRGKARAPAGFSILHEDEHLVVVVKPADWLTVPTPRGETDTLGLDRGVSGVLVLARTAAARDGLRAQLERPEPRREYVALVAGQLEADEGAFESRLATGRNLTRYSTRSGGEEAVTRWKVERRLSGATLVRVRLETGRRNQIRVHFAEAGHPVLGDPRYAPERARHRAWTARRLALHAATLAFVHPLTGRRLRFEAPLPAEVAAFLRQAGTPHVPARDR